MQERFSPSQKAVAEYIMKHYSDIPFQTITQIAEITSTSETTVSKFCTELGFSGFSGLKHLVGEYVNSSLSLNSKLEHVAKSLEEASIAEEILASEIRNIQATLKNSDNCQHIQPFIDMIDAAKHVYTIGARTSSFLAGITAFKLRQQDVSVSNIEWGVGDYIDKMMMIRPGDLVIAFSFSRFTKNTIKMVRLLKQRGISIVLITGEGLSPAYESADLVFACKTVSRSYVASYTACLSLIDAILVTRAIKHKDHIEAYLQELETNFQEFDFFTE